MASSTGKRGRPRKRCLNECHEVDEKLTTLPSTRSKRSASKTFRGTGMVNVNFDQSTMEGNGLIDVESDPSTHPARSTENRSGGENCELFLNDQIMRILKARGISSCERHISVEKAVRHFVGVLQEGHKAEIFHWERKCQSLQEQLNVKNECFAQGTIYVKALLQHLEKSEAAPAQATGNSADGMKRCGKKQQVNLGKQINNGDSQTELNVELQKRSDGDDHESLKLTQANNDHSIKNGIFGFYVDGAAKPSRLHTDMSETMAVVTRFQKILLDIARGEELLPERPRIFFVRPNHIIHYVKSLVNRVLFQGFENESFDSTLTVSRSPDRNRRHATFYSYYLRERERKSDTIEDPEFEEFCEVKLFSILQMLFPTFDANSVVAKFRELGDPSLVSSFNCAAKSVWLLHKLAFSFEPPATLLTVEKGADFDLKWMKSTIVELDDDESLVPKVSFMIDPGMCLNGQTITPCEVYLAKDSAKLSYVNKRVYHRKNIHPSSSGLTV